MRRIILFLILLSLGVGLLVILAESQDTNPLPDPATLPKAPSPAISPDAVGAQTYLNKLHLTQYRSSKIEGGAISKAVESELWAEEAYDQGNGFWMLKGVKIRMFQEKDPERESFALLAKRGIVALSGSFGSLSVDASKPVHFEDVVADFFEAGGDFPPLRVRTPALEGLMNEQRLWTESPFTLGQPEGEDFEGSGVGFEGDARNGSLSMKKDPKIRYWVRPELGAPVERELRLQCAGPLILHRVENARVAQAEGQAVLEIQEKKSGAVQRVRADKLVSRMRSERPVTPISREPSTSDKKRLPVSFERVQAIGHARIESAQALLLGDEADAAIARSGRLEGLSITGHPRAAFASGSASSLGASKSGQESSIFLQCDGPLELSESADTPGELRLRFEKNVLLFGASAPSYLPSRFGEQLDLQIARIPAQAGSSQENFRILGGQADGDVAWRGGGMSVFAPTMRMKPVSGGTQVVFAPSPFVETRFASAAFSAGSGGGAPPRALHLFATDRLVQSPREGSSGGSEILLDGHVLGRLGATASGASGKLESNGLRVVSPRPGVTQLGAEQGFLYDEGAGGLRLSADRVEPLGEQGMRLIGSPAELRQPSASGKPLELAAASIGFDPVTGEFRAQGEASATLPQESADPIRLLAQVIEGARSDSGEGLKRLEAYQSVKLHSQGQDAGGESLLVDFSEKVHRLFGTDEKPAWIAGPMDQGRFRASARRIEIRDSGSNIVLAPGAKVELHGKAVDFGALTPKPAKDADTSRGGVRVLPAGESRIEKEKIVFTGGVRIESLDVSAAESWEMYCRELRLKRDPATGELIEMEAIDEVHYAAADLVASGTEMRLWPKTSELLLLGDERRPATFQIPLQVSYSSTTRIKYNLETHLLEGGSGSAIPVR